MTTSNPLREFLLAFADDEHLMGQQHTEWIGVAPFLEEDLAFSSIGQDELGHAVLLYELVCELDGTDSTSDAAIDALAYNRSAAEYRSCGFTEFVTTDWAQALVRHWIYDMVEELRWELVSSSTNTALAEISERVAREETYHRMHANALLDVLLADSSARSKLLDALHEIAPLVSSLFAPTAGEAQLIEGGVLSASAETLAAPAMQLITERFEVDLDPSTQSGGDGAPAVRGSERTEHFQPLMTRMREVIDYDLEAKW